MELYRHAEPDPAADVAVSHALLERAARERAAALRLWRPARPALSLGRIDLRSPCVGELCALARAHALTPVRRLAGGRAATLDAGCLCIGWAQPQARVEQSGERYRLLAGVIAQALQQLGVCSRLGEAAGEWCPGAWSVQARNGKLAGLAQRVISGAAWCEALIVVERSPALGLLGRRVHETLGLPWRAAAQGELAPLLEPASDPHSALSDALLGALTRSWPRLQARALPADVRERARGLRGDHRLASNRS